MTAYSLAPLLSAALRLFPTGQMDKCSKCQPDLLKIPLCPSPFPEKKPKPSSQPTWPYMILPHWLPALITHLTCFTPPMLASIFGVLQHQCPYVLDTVMETVLALMELSFCEGGGRQRTHSVQSYPRTFACAVPSLWTRFSGLCFNRASSEALPSLLKKVLLAQHCPVKLSLMSMFFLCTVQYGNHQSKEATETLECVWCDCGTPLLILIIINLNSYF